MSQEFIDSYFRLSVDNQNSTAGTVGNSTKPKTNNILKPVQNVEHNQCIKFNNSSNSETEIKAVETSSSNISNSFASRLVNGKKVPFSNIKTNKISYVVGNRVSEDTFKGAKKQLDLYLGNIDIDCSCDTIRDNLANDFKVNVIDCSELKVTKYSKSFKITVLAVDRDKLLNPAIWPTGVTCRKFFNYNKKSSWYNSKL